MQNFFNFFINVHFVVVVINLLLIFKQTTCLGKIFGIWSFHLLYYYYISKLSELAKGLEANASRKCWYSKKKLTTLL